MENTTVMVASNGVVVRGCLASIFMCSGRYEIVGIEGKQVHEDVIEKQPDILVFEISDSEQMCLETLKNINLSCPWTKIILLLGFPISLEIFEELICVCSGCIQGKIRPGVLCRAADMARSSDYFFLISNCNEFKVKDKKNLEVQNKRLN